MILHGINDAFLAKALREQSLLQSTKAFVPEGALRELAIVIWEHEGQVFRISDNDQEDWNTLPQAGKEAHVLNCAWMIGRLSLRGFAIIRRATALNLAESAGSGIVMPAEGAKR